MIQGILLEIWKMTLEASPYLLLGFFLAGVIRVFFHEEQIKKRLGKRKFSSVILASLFGIPLPLCSCGVMPVASSLRKSGASRGATTSFLISTPESGVDSIAISYAILDPILTLVRPVAAFITALFAGTLTNCFDREDNQTVETTENCCSCSGSCEPKKTEKSGLVKTFSHGLTYSFFDLLPSISLYLIQGLVLAGLISYLIPESWIQQYFGTGMRAKIFMLIAGIPLYICATSSTPIAAAFILKGMSPGTALVFLLAGPATNFATMILVNKILGKFYLFLYLFSISFCAIILGVAIDILYSGLGIKAIVTVKEAGHAIPHLVEFISAIIVSILLFYGTWLENIKPKVKKRFSK